MTAAELLSPARRAMRFSLAAGLVMLVLKISAYLVTGSAAILGDAAESVVHMVAVGFAAFSVWFSEQPADHNHPYGHSKIAFISAAVEGALIALAAFYIIFSSIQRWSAGAQVANVDQGVILTVITIVINGALGWYLIRTGKRHRALILVANGKHVLTDGWTSLGAVVGLGLMVMTGKAWWDPVCGLIMAANILISGYGLLRQSLTGLMDEADASLAKELEVSLTRETALRGVSFHALRHRNAGQMHYVDVHFLFPGDMLLKKAHLLATEIEIAVEKSVDKPVHITTHLECEDDHDEIHPGDRKVL